MMVVGRMGLSLLVVAAMAAPALAQDQGAIRAALANDMARHFRSDQAVEITSFTVTGEERPTEAGGPTLRLRWQAVLTVREQLYLPGRDIVENRAVPLLFAAAAPGTQIQIAGWGQTGQVGGQWRAEVYVNDMLALREHGMARGDNPTPVAGTPEAEAALAAVRAEADAQNATHAARAAERRAAQEAAAQAKAAQDATRAAAAQAAFDAKHAGRAAAQAQLATLSPGSRRTGQMTGLLAGPTSFEVTAVDGLSVSGTIAVPVQAGQRIILGTQQWRIDFSEGLEAPVLAFGKADGVSNRAIGPKYGAGSGCPTPKASLSAATGVLAVQTGGFNCPERLELLLFPPQ